MKRTRKLLVSVVVLVCGFSLIVCAGDKSSVGDDRPCCGGEKVTSPKVGTTEMTCLQIALFEDGDMTYWSADCYDDSLCTNAPVLTYLWAPSGASAPQYCAGVPGCTLPSFYRGITDPVLKQALPKGQSYVDVLKLAVHYPGLPADRTWNSKDAVKDLGELKATFVKVKNSSGRFFAVRLSAGIAEMEKIQFPAGAFPPRPKIADRKILVGFEAEMDEADVAKLNEAIPTSWKRYEGCATAFVLNVDNSDYCVTTTAANPVQILEKVSQPATKKSVEKK